MISRIPTTAPVDRDWPPNITPAGICVCKVSIAARFPGIFKWNNTSGLPKGVRSLKLMSSLLFAGGAKAAASSAGKIQPVVNSIR